MRFFLACFLLLSPILVMGNLELLARTVDSKPNAFRAIYSNDYKAVTNWIKTDGPESGSDFEVVKQLLGRRARGEVVNAETLAGFIENDLRNFKFI